MEPWMLQVGGGLLVWAGLAFAVVVGLFLACRWLFLWYWRVNEAVAQLTDAAESLRAIRELLRAERGAGANEPPVAFPSTQRAA